MPDFSVGAPGTLEEVLDWNGYQRWRAEYLILCRGVTATRNRVPVNFAVDREKTKLERGDVLTVPDPEPASCSSLRQVIAVTPGRYRDYVMVAAPLDPNDTHLPRLVVLFGRMPDTVLLNPPGGAVREYLQMLKGGPALAFPIRDVMLGAHASPTGAIVVPAKQGELPNLTFERLKEAVGNGSFKVDPKLLEPRPQVKNVDLPTRFVIRGCGIGQAQPYLKKLKEALGGALEVVAPKFEHAAGSFTGRSGAGVYEFLAYEWVLGRPTALRTYKDVLAAFSGGGFKDYRGDPVSNQVWTSRIPAGDPPQGRVERLTFPTTTGHSLQAMAFFRIDQEPFPSPIILVDAATDPGNEADRRAALVKYLGTEPIYSFYSAGHEWPFFRRLGFPDLKAMIDGYSWSFRHDARVSKLVCKGTRVVYTVHHPIVDAKGQLIHNLYPLPAGKPSLMFTDRDPQFFEKA